MNIPKKKHLQNPVFILDDNRLLVDDLCDALIEQLDEATAVKELTDEDNIPLHAHIIYDVSLGEEKLYAILKQYAPLNIWFISGKNLSKIQSFRKEFTDKYPSYGKCLRSAIFQKPLDEIRLLAEIEKRERRKKKWLKKAEFCKNTTKEIQIYMGLHRSARLIDEEGRVLCVNDRWSEGASHYRPPLPLKFSPWLKKLRETKSGFIIEQHWLSEDEAETQVTTGYFELHSYAMKDSPHVVQLIIPSDRINPWQADFSEDNLIELCKPVMGVLVQRLFTRARLYRVKRYPDRGIYKKALYSKGETRKPFEGMHKGCKALNKRFKKYEKSSINHLKKSIVKIKHADEYWNDIVDMEGVTNWLEVPIIVLGSHNVPKTVALLVFDRKKDKDKSRIWDYSNHIKKEEIKSAEKLLLDSVIHIGKLFQVREQKEYYEMRKDVGSWWFHSVSSEKTADQLAISVFKRLLENKKISASDALLIKLRGVEATTLETKKSIENDVPVKNPKRYDLTTITKFNKSICLYPESSIPEELMGSKLEHWNKQDYRLLLPVRSAGKVWYIFCLSRKPSNDLDAECKNCWYRYDKNIAEYFIRSLADYLSDDYTAKLAAHSIERIFIHEAITLFSNMRNLFPSEYDNNDAHQPMLRQMKQLEYFLDNMRTIRNMSMKNSNTKMSREVTESSIKYVINNIKDRLFFRRLKISISETIDYFDLRADKFLFELVIYNLINNAVRYASKNSTIMLSSREDDIYWTLIISNKIDKILPENQLETLFDAYVSYSQTNRNKGIGLGLANSRLTALDFGGDLKVEQDEKNKVISFLLMLPLYNHEE